MSGRAVLVYESMYGNTHEIANAVAQGLGVHGMVAVLPVAQASEQALAGADLVVVGGPTHVHGMTRSATRRAAAQDAAKPERDLTMDAGAQSELGVREWLRRLGPLPMATAAFDTRMPGPTILTGRASRGINRMLRRHGSRPVCPPKSFLVTKQNELAPGELDRAKQWGEEIGRVLDT